jgi:hypothetical protein
MPCGNVKLTGMDGWSTKTEAFGDEPFLPDDLKTQHVTTLERTIKEGIIVSYGCYTGTATL